MRLNLFRSRQQDTPDLFKRAKDRQSIIDRLESMGYFVRPKTVPKPKIGDSVRFRVGAGYKINTHYYQTGIMTEWESEHPRAILMKELGYVRVVGKKSDHYVHPYCIVKVTKQRHPKTKE